MPNAFDGRVFTQWFRSDSMGALFKLSDHSRSLMFDQYKGIDKEPEMNHITNELVQHGGLELLVCGNNNPLLYFAHDQFKVQYLCGCASKEAFVMMQVIAILGDDKRV